MSVLAGRVGGCRKGLYMIVGTGRDPDDNSLRVYLNARYTGLHTHISAEATEDIARAEGWTHMTYTSVPRDALCNCHPELTPALGRTTPTAPDG